MQRRKLWGTDLKIKDTLDSTNRFLMESDTLEPGQGLVALKQTEGRGRLGRRWEAGPEGQLYGSFWVAPAQWPFHPPGFTLFLGLALYQALQKLGLTGHSLKWPNDLLVGDKKLAGILCESKQKGIVAGIGVNLKGQADDFPDAVKHRATSLEAQGLIPPEPAVLFELILDEAELLLSNSPDFAHITNAWVTHCGSVGKWVLFEHQGTQAKGQISGLTDQGGLIVRSEGEAVHVHSGEILFTEPLST